MSSPNKIINLLFIFGTRPEAIKMAPVILLAKKNPGIRVTVCVTGQHREMLDQVLDAFEIRQDIDLNLMKPQQTLSSMTADTLNILAQVLAEKKPDCVVVHGDTTTTLAASLAAYYSKIPVAHIEAGLRTHNIYSPWPEEINRRITGSIARIHFAPTASAQANLLAEAVPPDRIFVTGNTVIDALQMACERLDAQPTLTNHLLETIHWLDDRRRLILVTGHRRENFGEGFEGICHGLMRIASRADVQLIYPVHLNPNVQAPVRKLLSNFNNIKLIDPLDYFCFVYLLRRSTLVLTDSGGIQEEAPSLGKPVLVMRNTTERPEAVSAGTAILVGTDPVVIEHNVNKLLDNSSIYNKMSTAANPFGDGNAAIRIITTLLEADLS